MKILFSLLLVLLQLSASATNYFVSTAGSDSNNGLTTTTSWHSIEKVNSSSTLFQPGDSIFFKRGDSFSGTLRIKTSGIYGSPIVISAYGSGSDPVITGFYSVSSWNDLGGNIWESASTVSSLSNCNVVSINNKNSRMGRWPNGKDNPQSRRYNDSTFFIPSYYTGRTSVTDQANFNASVINWTGGNLVTRVAEYFFQRGQITNHVDSTIFYTSSTNFNPASYTGMFIQNHLATLDKQDEWFYNSTNHKLYVYSASSPANVKAASLDTIVKITSSYVTIENLMVTGGNTFGIFFGNVSNVIIQNCYADYNFFGIYSKSGDLSNHITIRNNTVNHSNDCGITLYSRSFYVYGYNHSYVIDNTVLNSGVFPGMGGKTENGSHSGIMLFYPKNLLVHGNIIDTVGFNGIHAIGGDSLIIESNYVNLFGLLLEDGGGIYCNIKSTYRLIKDNFVSNMWSNFQGIVPTYMYPGAVQPVDFKGNFGIYIDDGGNTADTTNHTNIIHNTVNNGGGIIFAAANNLIIEDNLIYQGNIQNGRYSYLENFKIRMVRNKIYNNYPYYQIIIGGSNNTGLIYFGSNLGYSSLITIDSNYYIRPADPLHITMIPTIDSLGVYHGYSHMPLSEWQQFSGFDMNSSVFPLLESESPSDSVYILSNYSDKDKIYRLDAPMIDAESNKYWHYIILHSYESEILMQDPSPSSSNSKYNYLYRNSASNRLILNNKQIIIK